MHPRRIVQVIWVVQSKNILLRFLRHGHADDGCSCKHRAVSPSVHIELIWCLLMVQYLQNNVIMKWTTRFTSFNGWIPLKYGSTTTPPIIAHCQNLQCQASNFTLRSPKTSNIRRTQSLTFSQTNFKTSLYYKTRLILENWWYFETVMMVKWGKTTLLV